MKSLSPYVLAKRNLAMTVLFMAVMTFLAIYVSSTSMYFAIGFFVVVQSIGVWMLKHYLKKVKELKEDQST
ncbi:hypothetical protein [Paenibacillus sp. FSL R5-0519]|uniref:hypothetical protein n=1 Tax=Paenibacillus sp. FSL R5-0519 TaxID=2921648 RepID=UPI0030D80E4A